MGFLKTLDLVNEYKTITDHWNALNLSVIILMGLMWQTKYYKWIFLFKILRDFFYINNHENSKYILNKKIYIY